MKKLFIAHTFTGQTFKFKLKNLKSVHNDYIHIKFDYTKWMADGIFDNGIHYLTPENLKELIDVIESDEKLKKKFFLDSTKAFIKQYPTTELLNARLEEYNKLPKHKG